MCEGKDGSSGGLDAGHLAPSVIPDEVGVGDTVVPAPGQMERSETSRHPRIWLRLSRRGFFCSDSSMTKGGWWARPSRQCGRSVRCHQNPLSPRGAL